MEPITVLSLNDDCLCNIVSFVPDCSSFNSVARTCKRFRQLTSNPRNCRINILRSKVEYYLKHFIVNLGNRFKSKSTDGYDEYLKLKKLVDNAVECSIAKTLITFDKVVNVWRENGPVASTVFSWVRNQSSSTTEGEPRATCTTEYQSSTYYLPKCNQELTVNTSSFVDYIGNYDREIIINLECGALKIKKELYSMIAEDHCYWSEEQTKELLEPMKPLIELLQKELGETIPSITVGFLVWFLFFSPSGKLGEDKLIFKDVARNDKPNIESIQPMLELYQTSMSGNFQKSATKWMNTNDAEQESEIPMSITETLNILVQKSDTSFLQRVKDNIYRFYNITTSDNLRNFSEKIMLELLLRTTLEPSNFSAGATADKYVDNTVYFRLLGSKAMKLHGGMHGDGASYPTWEELTLGFHLPDDENIQLETGDIYRSSSKKAKRPLDIEKLSPITKLLQDCISHRMQEEEHIPEISDIFTAVYFLHALDFGVETESFIGSFDESDLIIAVEQETDESDDSNSD